MDTKTGCKFYNGDGRACDLLITGRCLMESKGKCPFFVTQADFIANAKKAQERINGLDPSAVMSIYAKYKETLERVDYQIKVWEDKQNGRIK